MWPFDRYPLARRGIVNLKGGETVFSGVLWRKRGGYLVLRNAQLLRARAESVPMDGEVLVPLGNVEFVQLVGE